MNGNDKTLNQFLYENRISPTPEFNARMNATCGQIQQREADLYGTRIQRNSRKKRMAQKAMRRVLLTAACLAIVLAVSIIAIPSARAAVSNWISGWFSAEDYLGQESEERTTEPAMDAVITKAGEDGREIAITNVYDSDTAREMANNFGIRLDEVAYTGDTIYITGWFTGVSGKFLLDPRTGGDTVHADSEFTEGNMMLTLPDGTVYYGVLNAYYDEEMESICSECFGKGQLEYDASGNLTTTNAVADALWYDWLKTHEVRFTYTAVPESAVPAAAPLSGKIDAMLSFQQYYHDVNSDSAVTLFRADLGTVTIDADAYASVTTEKSGGQSVSLSGFHQLLVEEWEYNADEAYIHSYVHALDFSGVTINVDTVRFTPAGLDINLRLDLPEGWTRAERIAAIQGGKMGGIDFVVLIDGEEVQHPFLSIGCKDNAYTLNKDDPFLTSPRTFSNSTLSRSQWDSVKTITFIPCCNYPTEASVVEVGSERTVLAPTRLDADVVVTMHVNQESTQYTNWQEVRMDDYAITINLDDYR